MAGFFLLIDPETDEQRIVESPIPHPEPDPLDGRGMYLGSAETEALQAIKEHRERLAAWALQHEDDLEELENDIARRLNGYGVSISDWPVYCLE